MTHYAFGRWTIESAVHLPELPIGGGETADFLFSVARAAPPLRVDAWNHHWRFEDGAIAQSLARLGDADLLRFPDSADFLIDADGRRIRAAPFPGVPPVTIRHLFIDLVLPLLVTRAGALVLHGGAIDTPVGAVALVGPSGRGKSTLCAAFAARGHRVLADDCVILERRHDAECVVPAYPGLRLWPDSAERLAPAGSAAGAVAHYHPKQRVMPAITLPGDAPEDRPPLPLPLRHVYLLDDAAEPASGVRIERAAGRDAFLALHAQTFRLEMDEPRVLADELQRLGALARARTFRLAFPRAYEILPDVVDAVLEHAARAR